MATKSYTTQAGDSLSKIAQTYGVKISDISGYKSGDPNKIGVGENLTIKTGGMDPVLPSIGTMTSQDMSRGTNAPEPVNYINTKNSSSLSDKVSQVASSVLTGNNLALDNLKKQQQDLTEKALAAEEKNNKDLQNKLKSKLNDTSAIDAFNFAMEKYHVDQNIKALQGIQEKIVDAQKALNMGLIYEGDRPAREKLIQGRSASLQKQGLATIGALQGSASIIQGNINLGMSYAESTVNAINDDNTRSLSALQTLLNMSNNSLVDLKADEKAQVESRIADIHAEMDKLQKNKDDVLDLMVQYPKAFANGGVTLLDTKEEALQKMLPTMAADERAKFNADMAAKNRANSSGSANLTGFKSQLLQGKANGMSYSEAIIAFGDTLPIDYINSVYDHKTSGAVDSQDLITNAYYNQFIDPTTNSIKPGYTVSIDPKNGRPIVNQTQAQGSGFLGTVGSLFNKWMGMYQK